MAAPRGVRPPAFGLSARIVGLPPRAIARPTSPDRCREVPDAFLADPDEARRTAPRTAYLEIPETQRRYVLGDMDAEDGSLVAVAFGPGGTPPARGSNARVTEKEHGYAREYFAERDAWAARAPADEGIDGPGEPGLLALRNDFPVPVTVDGTRYPTVAHAYRALSTDDPERREIVRVAENPHQTARLGRESPRRRGRAGARTAVMLRLLRAEFEQHPDLPELLLSTGDRTILYDDIGSPSCWGRHEAGGRDWAGRLLEVVRAERCADRAGI
ncbi:NADAR family protein [Nocardiopsis sp. N85]|uniref:NADAR family protein n=1 Tax=Nocardiopsis sp. N85 TaxID=3029400 RepID=UPI00237FD52A|nr:NADAR family protein [Nocardiopsis sp. N85]MDE3720198.1 NADAR family protein [Nocardiopsis sp. N85]